MDKKLLLQSIGDQYLSEIITDYERAVDNLVSLTGSELPHDTVTGNEILAALEQLSECDQRRILATLPEPRARSGLAGSELGTIINHLRKGQSGWKTAVAVFMALLVGVLVIDYAIMMYIATVDRVSLPVRWEDITFIILVPGGIVWAWFGVLNKENRDLLATIIGEVPIPGPVGSLIKSFTDRSKARKEAAEQRKDQSNPMGQNNSQQHARERYSDSGDVNDNPPPGSAQ